MIALIPKRRAHPARGKGERQITGARKHVDGLDLQASRRAERGMQGLVQGNIKAWCLPGGAAHGATPSVVYRPIPFLFRYELELCILLLLPLYPLPLGQLYPI